MVFSYVLILYTQTIRENFEFASIKILQILVKIKFSLIIVNLKTWPVQIRIHDIRNIPRPQQPNYPELQKQLFSVQL